jgi:endonuclease YncB( thermonuclease family)
MSSYRALIVAIFLGLATPAWATVTLHFTFGLTREADACWGEGDHLKYRVGGQTYEIVKAEVARIEGECSAAAPLSAGAAATPAVSAAELGPTDAMLAAGRVTLAPPSWSPPFRGGCRTRGVDATLREVIDGDTITVRMPDGHTEVVRYIGMNAPELHHPASGEEPGGRAAKTLNKRLLNGKRLELAFDVQYRDRYGRLLAYVYASGEHVNATLLERGYAAAAIHPPNTCFVARFRSLERPAREGRHGLWGEPGHEATLVAARELNVLVDVDDDQPGGAAASRADTSTPAKSRDHGPVRVRGY